MTVDEVVTLASLIEMEALYPADFKKISSVFHNRLKSEDLQAPSVRCHRAVRKGL